MSARTLDFYDQAPDETSGSGFTRAPGDVELLHRPEGFSGAISLPLLPDLIQIYTVSLANGALTIRRGAEFGTIWFQHGEMVHAVCGETVGEEAVYRLLQWHNGNFSLDPSAQASVRSITASWQNVLMEGCRRLDEAVQTPAAVDQALAELEQALGGVSAVALYAENGALIGQRSPALDLGAIGPDLVELLARQARVMEALSLPAELLDCLWTLGDQVHFIQPLGRGRMLHLAVAGATANLAVIRRAVDRVTEQLT